ncbi:C45 family autoproteolytic acyltransferase/hydrolase [Virgibacillus soli]
MTNVYSDLIQFSGTHYDFGFLQGERLKDSFILPNRRKQWGPKPYHFIIDEKVFEQVIKQFAPGIWDEIHGLASALKWPVKDAIREFGGYYLEYGRSGCSIFTGENYMVRNYDNHPHSYEGRYVLFNPTDQGYATIGPSMQITGRTDGLNEMGLAMGYNFTNRKHAGDGFMCNMVGRIILEVCANIDEAISLLKELPHRHSFSYVLIDKTGKSVVVEASPRKVITREANVCTNHFQTLTEENRFQMDDSLRREKSIENISRTVSHPYEAFRMMNDANQGIFSSKYAAWAGTLHTALYIPNERRVGFTLGNNQKPLMIDFGKWLNGDDLHITRIKGSIPTTSSFVNMVEL